MKRGLKAQYVTLFVIIAIALIAIVLTAFLISKTAIPKTPKEISEIKSYVQSCLEDTSKQAILFMGQQGGYAEPKQYLETNLGTTTYWIYNDTDYRPSTRIMEESISQYVFYVLPLCLNSFNQFPKMNITEGNLSVNSVIEENSVEIEVHYPIEIKEGETSYRLENFSSSIPIELFDSYNLAIELSNLNNKIEEINQIDKKELDAIVLQYSEEDYIYIITDNRTKLLDKPFSLVFAIK